MTERTVTSYPDNNGYSLLLAEDDDINRDIVRLFLSAIDGIALTEATDGREALTLCLSQRFDLLLLDLRLPIIDGDRIARHLRSSVNPNSATPIILSSAMPEDEMTRALVNCPYDRLLPKPLNQESFLAAIRADLSITI